MRQPKRVAKAGSCKRVRLGLAPLALAPHPPPSPRPCPGALASLRSVVARAAARIEPCRLVESFNVLARRPLSTPPSFSGYRRFLVVHPVRVLSPALALSASCARLSGAPSRTLLSSLSLRSAERLTPFLSARAVHSGSRSKGFPHGAVAHGLPPFRAPRLLARSRHYLSARAYRPALAGALPP